MFTCVKCGFSAVKLSKTVKHIQNHIFDERHFLPCNLCPYVQVGSELEAEVVRQLRLISTQVELSVIASVSLNIANKYPDFFLYKIKKYGIVHQISKRPEKLIESVRNRELHRELHQSRLRTKA